MAKRNNALAEGLSRAAGKKPEAVKAGPVAVAKEKKPTKQVLIGGFFDPEVRRMLLKIQYEHGGGKLRELLGEAINLLADKYNEPRPFNEEP